MNANPVFISVGGQKILKGFHLVFAAITLGGLLSMLALFVLKTSHPDINQFPMDRSIYLINNSVVYYSVMGNILTAMTYGLFTRWGFFKFDWIVVKWLLLIGLAVLFMMWFIPAVNGMTSLSDAGLNTAGAEAEYSDFVQRGMFWCVFLIGLFVAIFFISTIKPWGKRKEDLVSNIRRMRIILLSLTFLFLVFGIIGHINLNKLRKMPIENSNLSKLSDGVYEGRFIGGGGTYNVKVHLKEEKMVQIESQNDRHSRYEKFARPVLDRIIENQNANVDGITGATTTSKCIMKAVENALEH